MAAATFTRGGNTLTFSRNPQRFQRGRGLVQASQLGTGAERISRDYYRVDDRLSLVWPRASAADRDGLLAWWEDESRGMANSFTFTNNAGTAYAVRFARSEPPQWREVALGSYEIRIELRVTA